MACPSTSNLQQQLQDACKVRVGKFTESLRLPTAKFIQLMDCVCQAVPKCLSQLTMKRADSCASVTW